MSMARWCLFVFSLCCAAAERLRESGRFEPNYEGGSGYVYYDPDLAQLLPLMFKNHPNMTCAEDRHTTPFLRQIRGVNLGGWLVLEPWITPSLFYQFLGADELWGDQAAQKVGMDMYTFCEALGPEEGNRQLRRHWQAWVTEADIRTLFSLNLDTLRIPVGDWMWRPYGPYANCTAGSLDELDRVLHLAAKYGLKVVLDIHGVEGSQNGLDNSGRSADVRWAASTFSDAPEMKGRTFSHWSSRKAEWIGKFDIESLTYSELYWDRIDATLDVVRMIADQYAENAAVMGLQPLNEPWMFTPLGPLKRFYWEGYKIMKRRAPGWKWFMHDSFRLSTGLWNGFMRGCPDVVMDTHIYQAWNWPGDIKSFYAGACEAKHTIAAYEQHVMPVVVGEWSLATDNCAMWLNGFNDNLPGYPMVQCDLVPCAQPYMGPEQPGTPPDPTRGPQGPFGTGESSPSYGQCPTGRAWRAPSDQEATSSLALKHLNAWSVGHGWFFWNFKTELEPKWDYIRSVNNGWLPRDAQASHLDIALACKEFDVNETFACHTKTGASAGEIIGGVDWACANARVAIAGCEATDDEAKLAHASQVFDGYFAEYHTAGATCDFGGAAELTDESADGAQRPTARGAAKPELPLLQLHRGQVPAGSFETLYARRRAGGASTALRGLALAAAVVAAAGVAARAALAGRRRALAQRAELAAGLREGLVPAALDARHTPR